MKQTNPLLAKAQEQFRAKVEPKMQRAFDQCVKAGMLALHSDEMHDEVAAKLNGPGSDAEKAGGGAALLMGALYTESDGAMPLEAGIPAAYVLLCEVLQDMEEMGMVKVDAALMGESVMELSSTIMQIFQITPEKIAAAQQETQGKRAPATTEPAAPAAGILAQAQGAM